MGFFKALFGELSWTPPGWLRQIGARRFLAGIGATLLLALLAFAAFRYYDSLPKPARVVAEVVTPGISPIVDDELKPMDLSLNFSVRPDPRTPVVTVDSVASIDLIGKIVEEGISLRPAIAGSWRWQDENRLVFSPAEDWPAGQEYTVRYDQTLFAPNLILAENSATFTTPAFLASIDELIFYQDPVEHSLRKVVATLSFTHPVDPQSLERHLSYSMRDPGATVKASARAVKYEIEYDKHRRKAFIHSVPIDIPPQETYLTLHLSEELAPARGPSRFDEELLQNVRIPDIGSYFRVQDVQSIMTRNADDEPEQAFTVEFTDRVDIGRLQHKISAFLLPVNVTVAGRSTATKHWRSPREVTPEVIAKSGKLDIELNPVEGDVSQFHSAVLDVPEGRYVYLQIERGLESEGEFVMSRGYDAVFRAQRYPKEATIAQSGAILPLTRSHQLTLLSRGVGALRVELGRLLDGQINHLASQTGGDIKSPYFNNYLFNEDNLTARSTRFITLNTGHPKTAVYSSIDLSEYLPDGGYYFVTVQGWDPVNERPVGSKDRRFVLVTDLGLLIKSNADSTQDIFVNSIDTGQPVAGAQVSLLGKNGVPIMQRVTANDGHVAMPATNTFEREKTPTVFIVRAGADSIFMPYSRGERMLHYSRFDVGGEYVRRRSDADRLKAQVFTDRGLYRPGDTVKLASIVKKDDWAPLGGLPLLLNVHDPRGRNVMDEHLRLPEDGFLDRELATDAVFATGNYNVTLYLIEDRVRRRAIGSATFKVEEFLPDRLRIRSEISGQKPRGWLQPGDLVCEVSLENLFGTPAESRRVSGQLELVPSGIYMNQYPEYTFVDPLREGGSTVQPVSRPLAPASTNEQGIARLPLDVGQYNNGIYRLTVFTEGFEEGGGRSVKSRAGVMISPLDYLIGFKADGDLSFLDKESLHTVDFLAVDTNAERIALKDLTLAIVQERYVSTLVKRPNGTYAYQSILKKERLSTQDYSIQEQGNQFSLPTGQPGSFAVEITNSDGLLFSKVRYTVAGARNLAGNLERDAELALALDGDSFEPGEDIRMEITAPYAGAGLITIERDRVYAYKWFQSDTSSSVQTIRVPENLEGNAYVNVAFVRALDSPEIFVSPLSYAVAPFAINRAARTVEIDLDTPELVRPGDELEIGYRSSRNSRIVVYAVDEGILQVAKYAMPDPLAFFLRKMALQVSTFQMVDLILPDFADFQRLAAAPGGGEAAALLGRNLNPFRRKTEAPIAFWSGIVDAGPERKSVSFTIPDYFNGQLRVMAVAVADSAVGRANKTTLVRGPFVISPNVLTAVAPGDEFDVTVGLANNLEGSGQNAEIELTASTSEHLELAGPGSAELRIGEGREGRATFRVRAKAGLGAASIDFTASSGGESARLQATLSVRPSVAYISTVTAGTSRDDPLAVTFERSLYDQFAKNSVAASTSPLVLTDGLSSYLDAFPHACAEQIVSKVFPQIGFLGSSDYTVDESKIRGAFDDTVLKLRRRQTSEGGFLFWATSAEPAEFASVYIVHFFTDAAELGLTVPRDMLSSGLGFLRQMAAREAGSLVDARLRAYAIYVLTRNGTVTTNYLTNLHEYLDRQHADDWRSDLTTAYMAASYEMLKQSGLGAQLIGGYTLGAGDEMVSDFDTRLGRDAQYLYLLSKHFRDRLDDVDAETVRALVAPVMQNRFNTLSSAYTVLALGAYTRAVFDESAAMPSIVRSSGNAETVLAEPARFARAEIANDIKELNIRGSDGRDLYFVLSQTGFDSVAPADSLASGLEMFREYLDANGDPVTDARVGDELTVRLRVRSTGRPRSNVAVVDLLPGGFEVQTDTIRDRYRDWYSDYKDVREDRVVIYGTFTDRLTEIRYTVKLTNPGIFVVPSAFAGSMYDRSIQARTKPGRFEVRPVQ